MKILKFMIIALVGCFRNIAVTLYVKYNINDNKKNRQV